MLKGKLLVAMTVLLTVYGPGRHLNAGLCVKSRSPFAPTSVSQSHMLPFLPPRAITEKSFFSRIRPRGKLLSACA